MNIGELRHIELAEKPGRHVAVIATQGCPWRCPFCFNPHLVAARRKDDVHTIEDALSFIETISETLEHVVVTGGEPTMHQDLPDFLRTMKARGWKVHLETNGSGLGILRDIVFQNLADHIAMDVKAPLRNYALAAGTRMDPNTVREAIWLLKMSGISHEFRTTVVPGLHTLPELKEIVQQLNGADKWVLRPFVSDCCLRSDFEGRQPFARQALEQGRKFFEKRVKCFEIADPEAIPAAG